MRLLLNTNRMLNTESLLSKKHLLLILVDSRLVLCWFLIALTIMKHTFESKIRPVATLHMMMWARHKIFQKFSEQLTIISCSRFQWSIDRDMMRMRIVKMRKLIKFRPLCYWAFSLLLTSVWCDEYFRKWQNFSLTF